VTKLLDKNVTVTYKCVTVTDKTHVSRHAEVGQCIKRGRLRTGLSLEKFAPLVGISRRHLIRLENGENLPRPKLAAKIEEVLAEHGQPVKEPILGKPDAPFPEDGS
jgi:DNA-binding XRE family transcriptional regulator